MMLVWKYSKQKHDNFTNKWLATTPTQVVAVFLGAFAKFRKETFSVVMFASPCIRLVVRMEQRGSHYTDFHEIR